MCNFIFYFSKSHSSNPQHPHSSQISRIATNANVCVSDSFVPNFVFFLRDAFFSLFFGKMLCAVLLLLLFFSFFAHSTAAQIYFYCAATRTHISHAQDAARMHTYTHI